MFWVLIPSPLVIYSWIILQNFHTVWRPGPFWQCYSFWSNEFCITASPRFDKANTIPLSNRTLLFIVLYSGNGMLTTTTTKSKSSHGIEAQHTPLTTTNFCLLAIRYNTGSIYYHRGISILFREATPGYAPETM